jgi:uncharacterized protein YjiS (DUF1127 family)
MKHEPILVDPRHPTLIRPPAPVPLRLIRKALAALMTWDARWRERRHLEILTDEALADVGRTRSEIEAEIEKPFWRI